MKNPNILELAKQTKVRGTMNICRVCGSTMTEVPLFSHVHHTCLACLGEDFSGHADVCLQFCEQGACVHFPEEQLPKKKLDS